MAIAEIKYENGVTVTVDKILKYYPYRTAHAKIDPMLAIDFEVGDKTWQFIEDLFKSIKRMPDNHCVLEVQKNDGHGLTTFLGISDCVLYVNRTATIKKPEFSILF